MCACDDESGERNLILLLGDQLSRNIASLQDADPDRDIILMAEVSEEASYVRHHKKKIAFLFSAMRHFAQELEAEGWQVRYVRLVDPENSGSLTGEIGRLRAAHPVARVVVTEPGEYRLNSALRNWAEEADVPLEIRQDSRFLCSHERFRTWAKGRKQLRMEYFYREMRRETGLLMNGDEPEGGKWNFDHENRKPAEGGLFLPRPPQTSPDAITEEVLDLVEARFGKHFGTR